MNRFKDTEGDFAMVIREYGTENSRNLVFFQGSCEPWEEFRPAAEGLAKVFHVMLITPDGHDPDEHNDFIYSNQWIPLMEKCSLDEKIKLGALLDKKCGGGQIAHINIETELSKDVAWEHLNYIANKGVIYFAFNSKISVCEDGHGFTGGKICPKCGKPEVNINKKHALIKLKISTSKKI